MLLSALFALAVEVQAPAQGLEKMIEALEARTAARREAASAAWAQHSDAFLLMPSKASLAPLMEAAPEIQEPALAHLEAWLNSPRTGKDPVEAVLILLSRAMDGGGADRLVTLMAQLPKERHPEALRMAVERGGRRAIVTARTELNSTDVAMRQAAYESLLRFAPAAELPHLVRSTPLSGMDAESLAAMLDELTARELPEDFLLPSAYLETSDVPLKMAAVRFLAAHPQDDAEEFLTERALAAGLSSESRKEALNAFVGGAEEFRWRDGKRELSAYLKDNSRTTATEQVAWALFKLGEKNAKKYLLDDLEDQLRATPDDKRVEMALAKRQVQVGDFADAYRHYKELIDAIDDGVYSIRMDPTDWLYAARAAAGSRHSREAGDWLVTSGLDRKALEPYRDLPEFSAYLTKDPFKRLLGE